MMVVQSARIAGFRGNSIPPPSSGESQQNQTNSNAIISPINVAAHHIPSLAKRNRSMMIVQSATIASFWKNSIPLDF
jgi:hypothetical protein